MVTLPADIIIPLSAFIVSGLGIVTIVGVKMYQQASGAVLPLTVRRNTLEGKMQQVRVRVDGQVHRVAGLAQFKTVATLFFAVRNAVMRLSARIKTAMTVPGHWLDRHSRSLVSLIRGRQEGQLKQRGRPSDFMRHIGNSNPPPPISSKNNKKSV